MTEPDKPTGDRIVREPPRAAARGTNPLIWLLALALLGGAGYAAWRGWQWTSGTLEAVSTQQELLARLGREVQSLHAQADELAARQTDLAQAVQRNGTDVASVIGRVEDSNEAIARLNETVEGGRTRVQLAAVEQLLLMANDRLQLAHDANSALRALDLADQRLSRLNDPRLLPVREALSRERAALTTMALPDTTGFALALGDIQKRAATLPLRVHVPDRGEAPAATGPAQAADGTRLERVVANVKAALSGLFSLRRDDTTGTRLLRPDEAALVGQILELKLEGARLALLARDGLAFRELTGAARDWLARHYDPADTDVQLALTKLDELHGQVLAPAPPDISRSLTLLRTQLGAITR
ncbi:MAG: uroporphyrinogen-III C-methyltransferase [Nevskiaceae bacterium]